MKSRIPVLTYHSIDESGSVLSTSPEVFETQMKFLKEASFSVLSLADVADHLRRGRHFAEKTVSITFDDGFKNIYHTAYPILKEYGFKATVFLVTGHCGSDNGWDGQPQGIPIMDILNREEIADMSARGLDFGAHTVSHPDLPKLPDDIAADEITGSRLWIEELTGRKVDFFAYPYGSRNRAVENVVRQQFSGACSTDLGFVSMKSSVYALPRIDMYYFSRNNFFSLLESHLFSQYVGVRSALRKIKYQAIRYVRAS